MSARRLFATTTALAIAISASSAHADPLVVATPPAKGEVVSPSETADASTSSAEPPTRTHSSTLPKPRYFPHSPFEDEFPCWAIPRPRCGPYPLIAFGVQGGAAITPVGWERVVRPYLEAGVMTSVNHWLDFGTSFSLAYDKLESITAASMETKLRLRMWMPSGFFGDVYAGPYFERFAYPGIETGTRAGGVLGALFSFSDIVGLEGAVVLAPDVGGKRGDEFRYLLGARFSIPTIVFTAVGIAIAAGGK